MNESSRKRIFDIIQIGNLSDRPSRMYDMVLVLVILLNISVTFLATFDAMKPYAGWLHVVEWLTLGFFLVEYLLRLWTAPFLYPGKSPAGARVRFAVSMDGIVELVTILPFFFLTGAVALRMLRVVRIFHLFRINAAMDSFNVIASVIREKRNQIVSSLVIILILMLFSSLCMYSLEHEAQPDKFSNALSGMWWSVSALLTVGYGDVYPVTLLGKIFAVVLSFLGVFAVAIPTGIISAGFVEQYQEAQASGNPLERSTISVRIDLDSHWIGRTCAEVEQKYGMMVLLIRRGHDVIRPAGSEQIAMDDVLEVYPVGVTRETGNRA